ncbi:integrase core domain protein [Lasallia pustulata]|uniref:Integrase core domain protein n=1 Tax=Lasallia pustulata TaxID=136370 RepID=A0A1W5CTL4_9LECA|nr:integrase core domain protein [Lasallia pustulata]
MKQNQPPGPPSIQYEKMPPVMPISPAPAITIQGHGRELSNLAKMYTEESKYSRENDNFDFKLTVFHDICSRADVPEEAKAKAFPTMLRESNLFAYTTSNRYTSKEFYGVMIDTGASKRSTAGYGQYLAYKKINNIPVDISKAGAVHVQFGIGSTSSIGSIIINTPVGRIEFHIVKADTPFLLCIADMDNLKVYYNNLENVLVTPTKLKTLEHLTKYCLHCQKHGKLPSRFKFILQDDVNFNYSIIVDIMYIDNSPILHIVDEATRFQAARWLFNISAKHTWDILRLCWIDVYIGPPDYIIHNAGKNFISREFRQYAASMAIITKSVPVEAYWSIGMVERYHAVLRRAYKVIMDELQGSGINKDMVLQMAVKAVNDTAGPNGLMPTLLVFGAYPQIHELDPPAPIFSQRAMAIRKAMEEVRRIRAERQVTDALNQRNGISVSLLHNLPLNLDVLVWREGNAVRSGRWTGPFKLLGVDGETCKVELPSGPTDFRSTMVKPYLTEAEEENSGQEEQQDHDQGEQDKSSQEGQEDPLQEHPLQSIAPCRNADRLRQLPLRY